MSANRYLCEPCSFRADNREEWIVHLYNDDHHHVLDKHVAGDVVDGPCWPTGFLLEEIEDKKYRWMPLYEKDNTITRQEFKATLKQNLDTFTSQRESLVKNIRELLECEIAFPSTDYVHSST